jgi:hypothetical protein
MRHVEQDAFVGGCTQIPVRADRLEHKLWNSCLAGWSVQESQTRCNKSGSEFYLTSYFTVTMAVHAGYGPFFYSVNSLD